MASLAYILFIAKTPTRLLSMLMLALNPYVFTRLAHQLSSIVEALRGSASLARLNNETLLEIAQVLEYRVLERMAPAFNQGEDTDAMAMVLSGR